MKTDPTLPVPPGYGPVIPLDKIRHAGLSLPVTPRHDWCSKLNAVQLHAQEFSKAALSHPIAFARLGAQGSFVPVAVLGLRDGENLAVDAQGQWQAGSYVPAYVRSHPFCVVKARDEGGKVQGVICVQEDALIPGSPSLFDADGKPTAAWQPVQALLDAGESAIPQTEAFTRQLAALDLMEPFEAIVLPKDSEQLRMKGLWRVNETKLATLPASTLRSLIKQGGLRAIHAHLLSLEHFARLMVASAARQKQA